MSISVYDDHGIRFEYPGTWDREVTEDGPRTTIAVNAPDGLAFAIISLDQTGEVEVDELAREALEALHDEYAGIESHPATETMDGQEAIGHDIEFISLDLTNSCVIRCYRTPRRTILYYAQWTDLSDDTDYAAELLDLRRSVEETDS